MLLLNIFQHSDGSFAWDNLLFLLLALIAGYILSRLTAKKAVNDKSAAAIAAWETKYKHLENEYKSYKSNLAAADRQNEKSVLHLTSRVKALEGDIRVLSDEKNKFHHQLMEKDEEIKKYSKQVTDLDDNLKSMHEHHVKTDAEWSDKLKNLQDQLTSASAWEHRVKAAEEEAQKAKSAIGNAERKKLEAELRLKATTEYAGKVMPLSNELKSMKDKYGELEGECSAFKNELAEKDKMIADLQQKVNSSKEAVSQLKITMAQLELQKENNSTLKQEFDIKHNANIALSDEIDYLKKALKNLSEENEKLKLKLSDNVFAEAADIHETKTSL